MYKAKEKVANMSRTEFANLPKEILIVPSKPYMITTNIDVIDGLVNGAVGTLKVCERGVLHEEDEDAFFPKGAVAADRCAHDGEARSSPFSSGGERGRSKRIRCGNLVDTHRTSRGHTHHRPQDGRCVQTKTVSPHAGQRHNGTQVARRKVLAHRVRVPQDPHRLVYVAFSRCTIVNNLYLTNAKEDHRFHNKHNNEDKGMLSEFRRLEQHRLPTLTQRTISVSEPRSANNFKTTDRRLEVVVAHVSGSSEALRVP
ncbi:hypothetical protein HPB49_012167 [Dermacentor silvarum]|uniref:Uncharacterized protein n=1 Tax=Dermacentor silvarum TaxID=543639 RepID=A0ACB8D5D4_DERSI|nr:hypothetical protein HPB49_012167 [Dermacentor silvarum]